MKGLGLFLLTVSLLLTGCQQSNAQSPDSIQQGTPGQSNKVPSQQEYAVIFQVLDKNNNPVPKPGFTFTYPDGMIPEILGLGNEQGRLEKIFSEKGKYSVEVVVNGKTQMQSFEIKEKKTMVTIIMDQK